MVTQLQKLICLQPTWRLKTQLNDGSWLRTPTIVRPRASKSKSKTTIDTVESDLAQADRKDLVNRLASTQAKLVDWDKFNPEPKIKPASMLNRLLFCFLILMLVGEQLLAYATNYHR